MRFKRLSLALIVLSMSFSLFAAHSMFFSAGDYDALNLYGPRGNKVDALTDNVNALVSALASNIKTQTKEEA